MNITFIDYKEAISKVIRDLGIRNSEIPDLDFLEWIAECLKDIGSYYQLVKTKKLLTVNDYRATWCKQECFISDPKFVDCSKIEDINRPSPPLTSITLSMKTTRSIDNTNEIALISFQINDNVNQDGPTGKQSPYS